MTIYELINSPLVATLLAVTASAVGAMLVILVRIATRFAHVESSVNTLVRDVGRMADDKDVVRWSELATMARESTHDNKHSKE